MYRLLVNVRYETHLKCGLCFEHLEQAKRLVGKACVWSAGCGTNIEYFVNVTVKAKKRRPTVPFSGFIDL